MESFDTNGVVSLSLPAPAELVRSPNGGLAVGTGFGCSFSDGSASSVSTRMQLFKGLGLADSKGGVSFASCGRVGSGVEEHLEEVRGAPALPPPLSTAALALW